MTRSASISRRKTVKRKRRRAITRAACMAGLMAVIVIALRAASNYLLAENTAKPEASQASVQSAFAMSEGQSGLQPMKRQASQIEQDLKKHAKTSKAAAKIYKNRSEYPELLLSAYLNNPEMEDFVAGYLDAVPAMSRTSQISSDNALTANEMQQDFPLLLQWDKRWGYTPYGGSIIGLSGCGPTCLSMVLTSLKGGSQMTPAQVAAFSEEKGYYVEGSGTAWALMTDGASQLGLVAKELSLDEFVMKSSLDAGKPIICTVGPGDFTTEGHFILIYGYDEQGFFVNDPNSIVRSSQVWTFGRLHGQIKNLWSYSL